MNILVVAAHPDDELLGCGGTIARYATEHKVTIAILGEGVSARNVGQAGTDPAAVERLWTEARTVGALLGAQAVRLLGLPDNRFDDLSLLDIVKQVEGLIEEFRPQIVYTHHGGDLNIDHSLTFRAVLTATRPMQGGSVKDIYAFEVPSATDWAFQRLEPAFRPNVFVDISGTMDAKLDGLRAYASEVRAFPHPRSPEALIAHARRWGSTTGVAYAEAFELVRSLR